jgi:hypothetical protein
MLSVLPATDCIRFINARKMDLNLAATMMRNWWQWWNSPFPDAASPITPATVLTLATLEDPREKQFTDRVPHLLHGFDKSGNPIYWERTGFVSHQMKHIKEEIGMDNLMLRHIRIQTLLQIRLRYSSEMRGHSVEKFVVVFDMAGVKKMPDMTGIKFLKAVLAVDQDYYPERLENIIVINAPSFFASLYKLISGFIDPVTAKKIRVFDENFGEALRELVDDSQIPPEFGGSAEPREWCWPYAESSGVSPDQLRVYLETAAAPAVSVQSEPVQSDAVHAAAMEGVECIIAETQHGAAVAVAVE